MNTREIIGSSLLSTYPKIKRRKGRGYTRGLKCGRGFNGQNCRQGGGVRLGFEGGQFPFYLTYRKRRNSFVFKPTTSMTLTDFISICESCENIYKSLQSNGVRNLKIFLNKDFDSSANFDKERISLAISSPADSIKISFSSGCIREIKHVNSPLLNIVNNAS